MNAKYPHIIIGSAEYPPKPLNAILGKGLTYLQWGIMLMSLFGDFIFTQLKIAPPAIYNKLKEKKFIVVMVVMLLGNNLSNMLLSTGAFEVYADNVLIFSRLATGKMPTPQEIEALLI